MHHSSLLTFMFMIYSVDFINFNLNMRLCSLKCVLEIAHACLRLKRKRFNNEKLFIFENFIYETLDLHLILIKNPMTGQFLFITVDGAS